MEQLIIHERCVEGKKINKLKTHLIAIFDKVVCKVMVVPYYGYPTGYNVDCSAQTLIEELSLGTGDYIIHKQE